jgi:hypothetical protein
MAMTATIRSQPHPATTRSAESGRRRSFSTRSPFTENSDLRAVDRSRLRMDVVVSPVAVGVARRRVAYVAPVYPATGGEP